MADPERHLQDWAGLHVGAVVSIDEFCQIDASMVDGWLHVHLHGECGDTQLIMTLRAADQLQDQLAEILADAYQPPAGDVATGDDITQV